MPARRPNKPLPSRATAATFAAPSKGGIHATTRSTALWSAAPATSRAIPAASQSKRNGQTGRAPSGKFR